MRRERDDKIRPRGPVLRRCDVSLVVHHRLIAASKKFRHKTQLHIRLHPDAEKIIVDLIDIEKRVHIDSGLRAEIGAHIVIENCVETHLFEAAIVVRLLDKCLIIGAQSERGMTAANTVFPEMTEWSDGLIVGHYERQRFGRARSRISHTNQREREHYGDG
jgi:hypothetical protein